MGVVVAGYGEANRGVFTFPMHIGWEMSHTGRLLTKDTRKVHR